MAFDIGPRILCDGTQEGLLTALFYAESMRPRPSAILLERPGQTDLLEPPEWIKTEPDKAHRVYRAIRSKLPGESYWVFQSVYASNREDRGTVLMRYLRVGWQVGAALEGHLADPDVWEAMDISRKVGWEINKLTGLARFEKFREVFYCPLTPDHDIIEFLAPHFADRLNDQDFIIHDIAREKAVVYGRHEGLWKTLPLAGRAMTNGQEDPYTELWRAYHRTIAIEPRTNPKLQRQHMPRRYWRFLPEMQRHSPS